jgi:hypothetical protein
MSRHADLAVKYWTAVKAGRKVRWRLVERRACSAWKCAPYHPMFRDRLGYEIEILPSTISVNGIEVPAPLREWPGDGEVWYVNLFSSHLCHSIFPRCGAGKIQCLLDYGLVHATREAAVAHAKAMIAPSEAKP